jgi:hypothetical protein
VSNRSKVAPHSITSSARALQALVERCKSILTFRVVRSPVHEDTNPPRTFGLLRVYRERPYRHRATDERDEVAPFHRCNHSITSSARASSVAGPSTSSA